jgi:uncharacterized protein YyaL (SSP411 family)
MAFLEKALRQADGSWLHTYKNGIAKLPAFLDDYAYLIQSYISMSCTTVNVSSVSNYINDSDGNTLTVSKTPDNGVYSSYYSYLSTIYTPETNVTIALNTSVVSTAAFYSGYFKIAAGSVTLIVLATAN